MHAPDWIKERPRTKEQWRAMVAKWDEIITYAWDQKIDANRRGVDTEPYANIARELQAGKDRWYDSYDDLYNSLPD